MSKIKPTTVELNYHQIQLVGKELIKLHDDEKAGKNGMVLAQVFYDEMKVFHVPHQVAEQIFPILNNYIKNGGNP